MHRLLLLVLSIGCFRSTAGGDDFYRKFLSVVDTNQPGAQPIRSPLLTDTNNLAPKLTNSVVNLNEVYSRGQIGGVRLGMTMEAVTAALGKPRLIYGRCFGGPRFCYDDVNVIFDPSNNSVMSVFIDGHKLPRMHGGLSATSGVDQFQAILGKPDVRKQKPDFDSLELAYRSPRSTLRLEFSEGWLANIQLEGATASTGEKQNVRRRSANHP